MAAGVIQSLSKFRLAPGFEHPFLSSTASQEMALHDSSEEEEEMEEEEEEAEEDDVEGGRGEEMETTDDDQEGHGPRGKQETPTVAADVSGAEMTAQLLRFAERVSEDIQRYFGRKSQEDDSEACSIYEDRGCPQLSGRLLYYTDLVRISQNRAPEEDNKDDDEDLPPASKPTWRSLGSNAEEDERLGPLAELFEYALCRYAKPQAPHDPKKLRMERKYGHLSPMHGRKLPQSFWKEPAFSPIGVLGSNPPDFSDLLANWTSETSQEELHAS